ncbi:MAG: hypothetical protein M1819_006669 [Sarea resinae]|nr:MAG: hypothetical protein M1819_006669 [Sarea resinae]
MAVAEIVSPFHRRDHYILPPIGEVIPQIHDRIPPTSSGSIQGYSSSRLPQSPTGQGPLSASSSIASSPKRHRLSQQASTSSRSPTDQDFADYRSDVHLPQVPQTGRPGTGISPSSEPSNRRLSLASASSFMSLPDSTRSRSYTTTADPYRTPPQLSPYEEHGSEGVTLPSLFGHGQSASYGSHPRDRQIPYDTRYDAPRNYPPPNREMVPISPGYPPSPYSSQSYTPHRHGPYAGQAGPVSNRSPLQASGPHRMNFEMFGDYAEHRSKRRRGNLPKQVTDLLRTWFHEHLSHPYPSEEEKQMLMRRTGLTISQISNWFINARRRTPRPLPRDSDP